MALYFHVLVCKWFILTTYWPETQVSLIEKSCSEILQEVSQSLHNQIVKISETVSHDFEK